MKIVRLERGERPPEDSDYITINSLPNGRHGVSGVTSTRALRPEAVTMVTRNSLPTDGEAEAAGIRWGMEQGIDVLYVVRPT
jgi:hypothetical protein